MTLRGLIGRQMYDVASMCWGLWMMVQGAAGYERYMATGDTGGAIFDACFQIVGFWLFWSGTAKCYAAILRALDERGEGE